MREKVVGFDISKSTIDVAIMRSKTSFVSSVCKNDVSSFKDLLLSLPKGCLCVMEATGSYYLKLAGFLYANDYKVAVINPLVIRRYSQMKMLRSKTDKADAKTIAMYGSEQELSLWQPLSCSSKSLRQISSVIDKLIQQRSAWKNKKEALVQDPTRDSIALNMIEEMLIILNTKIDELELELSHIIEDNYKREYDSLTSIPGIGNKTAVLLIAITEGFSKFDSHKKLASYIGLCPRIYQSGTSVRGKSKICKIGMGRIRQLLFMCSHSASKYNKACKDLYDRLIEKGKAKKLALIAVANKLIRQAFGLMRNNAMYCEI